MTPTDVTGDKGGSATDACGRRTGAKGHAIVCNICPIIITADQYEEE